MPAPEAAIDRRLAAPHPGPIIKRDYVDAVGIDVASLAAAAGLVPGRLAAMLAGTTSFDVDSAIRLSRALGLPAERVMQMQLRADFASARGVASYGQIKPASGAVSFPFPERDVRHGRLGCTPDDPGNHASYFFQETVAPGERERYAGLHALWRGDCLRVYGQSGEAIWTGPILQNLDGRTLLPFVAALEWQAWFASAAAADLAIGPDHAEFFARMQDG